MSAPKLAPGRRTAKATMPGTRTRPAHRAPIAAAHVVDDAFFRHLVAHMRNGVLAINRAGELVLINDEACRIFGLPAGEGYLGRPFAEVFHAHPGGRPGAGRRLRAGLPAQPRRAAARAVGEGARLHAVAHPQQRRHDHRRGDVLQGPDPRRAARGARAAARPPGGAGRDGRRGGPRDQEPARRHRGDGRAAAPPAARQRPGHGAGRRHHQRSQDGQRHRPGDPRLRPAGAAADGAHRGRPGAAVGGDARRQQGQARPGRGGDERPRGPAVRRRRPHPAGAGVRQPADQRLRGARRRTAPSPSTPAR